MAIRAQTSTALLGNSIVRGRNKIINSNFTSRSSHRVNFSAVICILSHSVFSAVWRWHEKGRSEIRTKRQNDTSGRGARAQNTRQLESKQNRTYCKFSHRLNTPTSYSSSILFYNIIIHFNRRSVSISPLTCQILSKGSFIHNSP